MSAATIVGVATVLPTAPDRLARLPLRAELFLLAHDDDTGRPHLHPDTLAVGLAGAILLELWLAGRLYVGWRFDPGRREWAAEPGRLTTTRPTGTPPPGDPLTEAALAHVHQTQFGTGPYGQLREWVHTFATTNLYERVRASMLTVGVLDHSTRRRFGLLRTETYTAVTAAWAVRARGQIGSVVAGYEDPRRHRPERPDHQCVALCALVRVLDLTPHLLIPAMSTGRARQWLGHIVEQHDPTIGQVAEAVDAARGDLAVTAMG